MLSSDVLLCDPVSDLSLESLSLVLESDESELFVDSEVEVVLELSDSDIASNPEKSHSDDSSAASKFSFVRVVKYFRK